MGSIKEWMAGIAKRLGVEAQAKPKQSYAATAAKQGRGFGWADIGIDEPPKAEGKSTGDNRAMPRQKIYK